MEYKAIVKNKLSKKRYEHSVRVAETAVKLAAAHGENQHKAELAGLLHDYCKELPKEEIVKICVDGDLLTSEYDLLMPQILHGPAASIVLKDEGIVENLSAQNNSKGSKVLVHHVEVTEQSMNPGSSEQSTLEYKEF